MYTSFSDTPSSFLTIVSSLHLPGLRLKPTETSSGLVTSSPSSYWRVTPLPRAPSKLPLPVHWASVFAFASEWNSVRARRCAAIRRSPLKCTLKCKCYRVEPPAREERKLYSTLIRVWAIIYHKRKLKDLLSVLHDGPSWYLSHRILIVHTDTRLYCVTSWFYKMLHKPI